jgi:glycosyltransferase involved in cell wall biosynthesis
VDDRFRPRPRRETLETTARRLRADPDTSRGRSGEIDDSVREALARRDAEALSALSSAYDQDVPDRDACVRLEELAGTNEPVVAFLGKLIPQKGVHLFLQSLVLLRGNVRGLVVGFGGFREWLHALVLALDGGDREGIRWIAEQTGIEVDPTVDGVDAGARLAARVTFTGRLDHRYAPGALAAADVLVVPSILEEAFGMVAVEGAASGALPLVARHSGLAEIAGAIESAVGHPGAFSYPPGPGSVSRIAGAVEELHSLPPDERARLRNAVAAFATSRWSWDHTARLLLDAAGPG